MSIKGKNEVKRREGDIAREKEKLEVFNSPQVFSLKDSNRNNNFHSRSQILKKYTAQNCSIMPSFQDILT